MDHNVVVVMMSTIGHSMVAGAVVIVSFIGIVARMKYSASKDRTRSGYGRL